MPCLNQVHLVVDKTIYLISDIPAIEFKDMVNKIMLAKIQGHIQ